MTRRVSGAIAMDTFARPFITVFTLLLCAACNAPPQANSSAAALDDQVEKPTVALIMKSLANEFFVTMADGATNHQLQNSDQYELIVNGIKNEIDLAQQVALIDQMVAAGVDAIVIAPADSRAIVPALARASAAGVAIVNIDNRLDASVLDEYELTIPFVGPDNFLGAERVGAYLAKMLTAGDQVAILEGVPTAVNSQQRTAGFEKAMADANIDVVASQSAQWDQTTAVGIASGILLQFPQLSALLCANDNMALGAIAAVRQAGKSDQVKIVGFDNISAANDLVMDGSMLATADQHGDLLAVFGIEYALQMLLSDEQLPDRSTPVDLITSGETE